MPNKKSILITRHLPPDVMARAHETYDVVISEDDHVMEPQDILEKAVGAKAILCCISEKYDAKLIAGLPDSVKILSIFSVGTDHIDLDAASKRSLRVGNTPDAVTIPPPR